MVFRRYPCTVVFLMVVCLSLSCLVLSSRGQEEILPYHIKADKLSFDEASDTFEAAGGATVTRGDISLRADTVVFNDKTKEVRAWGDVRFVSGKDWLQGDYLEADLEGGTGVVTNGTLFIEESHFYLRGCEIHRTGKDSYYIEDPRFTTCDGDSPDWAVTGRELRVTLEGYGTIRDAAFQAKSVPVFYVPFLIFPAKTKRQTGLLFPQTGYSDQKGFEYGQPLFWAISESMDATFYGHYMAHRGLRHGLEYRYVLAPHSKGAVVLDYLHDRKIDRCNGPESGESCGFQGFSGDREDRTNRDRWWVRMKTDQALPAGFVARLDVDLVSDQDYLREFRRGYWGYKASDGYYLEEFGRGLEDETVTVRRNQLNVSRRWDHSALNSDLRWYDDVIRRKDDEPDPTLQMLPEVTFDRVRKGVGKSPFHLDLESSHDYFWREVGTKGHRGDVHPRLYYPATLSRYVDFEPSVGLRETLWQVEEYGNEDPQKGEDFSSRTVFDFRADLSSEVSRVFSLKADNVEKLKHTIRPQVVYDYVPVPDQDDQPYFEGIDRMEEQHVVTYSVTNYFTAKKTGSREGDKEEATHLPMGDYVDICRFELAQSYDIGEARGHQSGKEEPFSDILGELELTLPERASLCADLAWSPYEGAFTSYNALVSLKSNRGDHAFIDYRYTKGENQSIRANLDIRLSPLLFAYCELERDLRDEQEVDTVLGFRYESQCWSLNAGFVYDGAVDSQEVFFEISLLGLGQEGR
jgi:LPS-assembly protein